MGKKMRMRSRTVLLAAAIPVAAYLVCFLVSPLRARGGSPQPPPSKKAARPAAGAYAVVKVGKEYRALRASDVAALREELREKYKQELKAYEEARHAALKAKEKFDRPRPVLPTVRTLRSNFKTEEEANAYRDRLAGSTPKGAPESYSVVKVGEEIRVLSRTQLAALRKELAEQYAKELREYEDARRGAL
jgi:hypothetical protein